MASRPSACTWWRAVGAHTASRCTSATASGLGEPPAGASPGSVAADVTTWCASGAGVLGRFRRTHAELLVDLQQAGPVVAGHADPANDLTHRRLLLDLLLEEPVEQRPRVEVRFGLGRAHQLSDRGGDLFLVPQCRLEHGEHVGLGNLRGRDRANLRVVPTVTQVINKLVRVNNLL